MGDDIVFGGVRYMRSMGVWVIRPAGSGGMFHVDPRRSALLDEIERLRAENDTLRQSVKEKEGQAKRMNVLYDAAQDEINGLKAALIWMAKRD